MQGLKVEASLASRVGRFICVMETLGIVQTVHSSVTLSSFTLYSKFPERTVYYRRGGELQVWVDASANKWVKVYRPDLISNDPHNQFMITDPL
jgi:hypothetical protein